MKSLGPWAFFHLFIVILTCPDFSHSSAVRKKNALGSQPTDGNVGNVSSIEVKERSNPHPAVSQFGERELQQAEGTEEINPGWTAAPVDYGWSSYYGDPYPDPYHYYPPEPPFTDGNPVIQMDSVYSYNSGPPPRRRKPKRPRNLLKTLQKNLALQASKNLKSLQSVIKTITSPDEPATTTTPPQNSTPAASPTEPEEKSPVVDILVQLAPTISKLVGGVGNALAGEGSLLALKRDAVLARWKFRKALFIGVPESIIKAKFSLPSTLVSGKQTLLKVASSLKPQKPPPPKMIQMMGILAEEGNNDPKSQGEEPVSETPQNPELPEEETKLQGLYPPMEWTPNSWSNNLMPWMMPTLPTYYEMQEERPNPKGPEAEDNSQQNENHAKITRSPTEAPTNVDSEKLEIPQQTEAGIEKSEKSTKKEESEKKIEEQVSLTASNAKDFEASGSHLYGQSLPLMHHYYPNEVGQRPIMPVMPMFIPQYRRTARRSSSFRWGPFRLPRPSQFIF